MNTRPPRHLLTAAIVSSAGLALPTAAAAERPPPEELRHALDEILASGYRLQAPPQVRLQEWLMRGLRWLADRLGTFADTGPLAGLPLWLNWVIFGICVVLLGLIIAHVALTLRAVLGEKRAQPERSDEDRPVSDPRELMAAAEAAFGRADYDRAVRLLYSAVLLRLDRTGLLAHDPARTNWENVTALRSEIRELRGAMSGLARELDHCVYGGGQASAHTWERARSAADLLWNAEPAQ